MQLMNNLRVDLYFRNRIIWTMTNCIGKNHSTLSTEFNRELSMTIIGYLSEYCCDCGIELETPGEVGKCCSICVKFQCETCHFMESLNFGSRRFQTCHRCSDFSICDQHDDKIKNGLVVCVCQSEEKASEEVKTSK